MHLLNVDSLRLETFYNEKIPSYAILSHTWENEEITFEKIQRPDSPSVRSQAGFEKIRKTCEQAKLDEHQYVWIDTCCIDKSSSAELTEAINSMYRWYSNADTCYAYLSDVENATFLETFPESRWFSRGWTLQELIAPSNVEFYDRNWESLGSKIEHAGMISDITGVDEEVLYGDIPSMIGEPATIARYCVAKRMSWAAHRQTTRVEDMAYCLLGIFEINMPLLYGEGERAFIRLQEEIIRNYDDDSILGWDLAEGIDDPMGRVPDIVANSITGCASLSTILASSPKNFENCQNLEYSATSNMPFTMTNMGLQIQLPLIAVYPRPPLLNNEPEDEVQGWVGLLRCSTGVPSEFLGIVLWPAEPHTSSSTKFQRVTFGRKEKRTVVVGPLAAWEAVQKEITIIPLSESNNVRDYIAGYRHFIIVESQAFLDAGYKLSNAVVPKAFLRKDLDRSLDWTTKTFTVEFKGYNYDLVRFDFQGTLSPFGFSVYVRGTNAAIHKGIFRSDSEEIEIFKCLGDSNSKPNNERITLFEIPGGINRIEVSVTDKDVSFSQILQVSVDLISN